VESMCRDRMVRPPSQYVLECQCSALLVMTVLLPHVLVESRRTSQGLHPLAVKDLPAGRGAIA